jgi:hypothetical protein
VNHTDGLVSRLDPRRSTAVPVRSHSELPATLEHAHRACNGAFVSPSPWNGLDEIAVEGVAHHGRWNEEIFPALNWRDEPISFRSTRESSHDLAGPGLGHRGEDRGGGWCLRRFRCRARSRRRRRQRRGSPEALPLCFHEPFLYEITELRTHVVLCTHVNRAALEDLVHGERLPSSAAQDFQKQVLLGWHSIPRTRTVRVPGALVKLKE